MSHWTRQLQTAIYNIICKIWTSTHYNIINSNKKFKDKLEDEFVTTSVYIYNIYVLYKYSQELRIQINVII